MVVVIKQGYIRIYIILTAFILDRTDIQSNCNTVKPFWNTRLLQIKHTHKKNPPQNSK